MVPISRDSTVLKIIEPTNADIGVLEKCILFRVVGSGRFRTYVENLF